jgi:hypothetical protein
MSRESLIPLLIAVFLGATADDAFASVNYNSSKSNSGNFTFDPKVDLNGPKLCSDGGGTVKTGPGKLSTCVMPKKAAPAKAN